MSVCVQTIRWAVGKVAPEKTYSLSCSLAVPHYPSHLTADCLPYTLSSSTNSHSNSAAVNTPSNIGKADSSNILLLLQAEELMTVQLQWRIPMTTLSGLGVSSLSLNNESYKPYKGVRTMTKSGRTEIRVRAIMST